MKIVLICLLILILILLLIQLVVCIIHSKIFGHHFYKDPNIDYYTNEEFNINRKELIIKYNKISYYGYIYNYDNFTKDAIIIFCHGMRSTIDAYNQDICYLCKNGYQVIGMNYEGVGESSGKNIIGLSASTKSIDAIIKYVKNNDNFKNKKIYLVGHSWGAYGSLAALKFHKDIKKVVSISPFIKTSGLLKSVLPKYLYFIIPFIKIVEFFKLHQYANINLLHVLKNTQSKILILHSKDDPMLKFSLNTKILMEKLKNKQIKYLIVDNKGHNPNYTVDSINYMNKFNENIKTLTKDEQIDLMKRTDFKKMGMLDYNIMSQIVKFLDIEK